MGVEGVVHQQDLSHAGNRGSRFGCRTAALAGDQQGELAADFLCRRHGVQRCRLQRRVVMLGQEKNAHQITFASLRSLSTSSATLFTLTPDLRFGGSPTFRVLRRGAGSTPSCSGVKVSMGFFFAFMMLGSEA